MTNVYFPTARACGFGRSPQGLGPIAAPGCSERDWFSQVDTLLVFVPGAPGPAYWTKQADWDEAVDNTSPTRGRVLSVIGGVADPEPIIREGPRGYRRIIGRQYTFSGQLTSSTDDQYAFARALQCDPAGLRIWYATGSHLYGGPNGIALNSADGLTPLATDGYEDVQLLLRWNAQGDPPRCARPFRQVNQLTGAAWVDADGNVWTTPESEAYVAPTSQ